MDSVRNHDILGVPMDGRSRDGLENVITGYLAGTSFRRIATVNPEFLVRAHRDARFRENLLASDLRIPDGFGIVLDAFLSGWRIWRYPGADLLHFILTELDSRRTDREKDSAASNPPLPSFRAKEGAQESASTAERTFPSLDPREETEKGWDSKRPDVFLLIRKDGLSSLEEILAAVRRRYPNLSVEGAERDAGIDPVPGEAKNATVVFCNFGAPEQEHILESLRNDPGEIRLAMGVGGAFDYMTRKRRRAPRWMHTLGLEWLFRLLIQPKRVRRIWNAVVIFPFLCLSDRMEIGRRKSEDG